MATTEEHSSCQIYQFHALLLKISPAIWRRILIRSDSSIAYLHHVLQIVLGWGDTEIIQIWVLNFNQSDVAYLLSLFTGNRLLIGNNCFTSTQF